MRPDFGDEQIDELNRRVFPFWMNENIREWTKNHAEDRLPLELDERFVLYFMWKTQAVSHTVVDAPLPAPSSLTYRAADSPDGPRS